MLYGFRRDGIKAYCIAKWGSGTDMWGYINVYGPCFDCLDGMMGQADMIIVSMKLIDMSAAEAKALVDGLGSIDMRTLDMIKAGCCPPGLTNPLLEGKEL